MRRLGSVLYLIVLSAFSVFAERGTPSATTLTSPVTFLENKGQWDSEIIYKGNSMSTHVSMLKDGISFGQLGEVVVDADGNESNSCLVWNLRFVNPSKQLTVTGENGKPTRKQGADAETTMWFSTLDSVSNVINTSKSRTQTYVTRRHRKTRHRNRRKQPNPRSKSVVCFEISFT